MAIESIEPVGQGARPQQQAVADDAASGEEPEGFGAALDQVSNPPEQPQAVQPDPSTAAADAAQTIPAPASVETAQPVEAASAVEGLEPNRAVEFLERVGDDYARLDALITELRSGQSFTVQELLGLQAEIHKLSLEINTATSAINAAVSNVRTLFQQQV